MDVLVSYGHDLSWALLFFLFLNIILWFFLETVLETSMLGRRICMALNHSDGV